MAKKKKSGSRNKPKPVKKQQPDPLGTFIGRHPHSLALAALFLLLLLFFNDVMFGGKTFLPPDTISSQSIQPFVHDAIDRGIYPLWNPYVFSGMPSFASLQSAPYIDLLGDVLRGMEWVVTRIFPLPDFTILLINYFLLGLFTYLLIFKKTGVIPIALFAAVTLVFQPPIVAFTAFGHNTKLATAVLIPLIFWVLDEFLETRKWHYFALLALAVGLQLLRAHTQIAYYTFMMIGLYLLFWAIYTRVKKTAEMSQVLKSLGLTVVALIVGVAMSSWLYLSVLEYAEYSIRGGEAGLDYGYATSWSLAPKEMLTFFVPSFFGFGGQTYWGEMPFTDFPQYMGVVVLFLAGMAFVCNRNKYTLFFGILGLLALIVAFGQHLPILYKPLFELLPFFNKFRVPSMILILVQFAMVVLAAFGLHGLLNIKKQDTENVKKYIYAFVGLAAVILVFLLAAKGTYLQWAAMKPLSAALQQQAYEAASKDALKMLAFVAGAAALVFAFLRGNIKKGVLLWAMVVLVIIDLWVVGFKIMNPRPKTNQETFFAENETVSFLERDDSLYRIYPVADNKPANWYAYHKIQNILGYHAAKLKIYQNFLENTGLGSRGPYGLPPFLSKYLDIRDSGGQPTLHPVPQEKISQQAIAADNAILGMLNVKYLISYYPFRDVQYQPVKTGQPYVFENTGVLPRAFFADEIAIMPDDSDFFNYLRSGQFDPAKTAVLTEEPDFEIMPSENNRVEVTSFDIHEISLKAQVETPSLLVLSEIYYPAGWKAFVDGEQTQIYRTNTILRSIFLEPGEHDIRFVFEPKMFKIGVFLTFGILIVLLGVLGYGIFQERRSGV